MIGAFNPAVGQPLPTSRVIRLSGLPLLEVPGRVEPTPTGLRAYADEQRERWPDFAAQLVEAASVMETIWTRAK